MTIEYEIIAENLRFPEGPVYMPDGSIILVEIEAGVLSRVWENGEKQCIAELGGGPNGAALGPNGAALGPDGAIYICNNGGFSYRDINGTKVPNGQASADYETGSIERVDLTTGQVQRLYQSCDGHALKGPNDIVFDKHGGFYFTDLGKDHPDTKTKDLGSVYYANIDGTYITEVVQHMMEPNGVGLSPDEKTLYVAETLTGRLWAYDLASPGVVSPFMPGAFEGRVVVGLPDYQLFDSLAVTASGNICVGTLINGGITMIEPEGQYQHFAFPDLAVTNICFGGDDFKDAYLTLSLSGQLIKCRWPEPGLPLNFR